MIGIYGEVSVTDNKNNTFYVYKSDLDEDERISYVYYDLLLNCSSIAPIREGGTLNISIIRKDECDPIFEEQCNVDKNSIEGPIEGTSTLVLNGKEKYRDYRASIVYTRIPFAIVANVEFFIQFQTFCPEKFGTEEVYGKIKVNKSLCYERSGHQPLKMMHGQRYGFDLSRTVFAVPAHSPLVVEVRLLNKYGYAVYDKIEVIPTRGVPSESYDLRFPGKNMKFSFGMNIDWMLHEYIFGLPAYLLDVKLDPTNIPPECQINHSHEAVTSDDSPLVEFFSIVVCCIDSSTPLPTDIHGIILVRDQRETGYIFSSNVNGPDKLSDEQFGTLSLAWPTRWIVEKDFFMHLKLEDVSGRPVCTGRLSCADWDLKYQLWDRRTCDFIEGENGYFTAVHYSVFKNGKRAKVSAKWRGHSCLVYGSIVVAYSNSDYSSTYDQKYYQSVLFKKSEEDCVKLRKDCQIPLLKKPYIRTVELCRTNCSCCVVYS